MKIPEAYFGGGLGQRVATPAPARTVDNSFGPMIEQAGERLSNALMGEAVRRNEEQGRIDLMQAQELQRAAREREDAWAKNEYIKLSPQLAEIHARIVADPEIDPTEYPARYQEQAQALVSEQLYPKLSEHQQNLIVPHVTEQIISGTAQIQQTAVKQLQEQAWEEGNATLDALKADPTRDVSTKLRLIYDENLLAGSGKSPEQIREAKHKAAQEIMTDDATQRFNATKQDLGSLRQFKAAVNATAEDGSYRYLPGWDNGKRQQFVSMIMAKEEHLLTEARADLRARQAEARQAAREEAANLVMEYKDRVKTGWIPTTAADFRFVTQVRRAASGSPSLARQYDEATSYTTDFTRRLELKRADPLGVAAAERGVILPPLNVLDVASLPQQIASRLAVAKQLKVNAVFKGDEIKALSEYLPTLPPKSQIQLMTALSKPLGPTLAKATWNTAAEQARVAHPEQAVMFRLYANGKPAVAQLYAEGRAYLTGEKKDILKDSFALIQRTAGEEIDQRLGSALAAMPKTRNTVKDAIVSVYLARCQRTGRDLNNIDKDMLRSSIEDVAGRTTYTGSGHFGSGKTTLIPDGMTEDQFHNSIKAITPKDIARRGGVQGMSDAEAALYLKGRAWHESDGGYTFTRNGGVLYGTDGRPFVFRFDDGVGTK